MAFKAASLRHFTQAWSDMGQAFRGERHWMLVRTAASGCVRGAHRAFAVFPRWGGARVRGAGHACRRVSFPDRSSWLEELSLEFAPTFNEAMPVNDGLKSG